MTMNACLWTALALLSVPSASAQEQGQAREARRAITPLRVQIVFTKYQGEKKVASLPYTLTCNAGERAPAVLRMGIEVPVPVPLAKEGAPSVQYKNVGTNIDCRPSALEDGRYSVDLTVEQSSIYSTVDEKGRRPGPSESDGRSAGGMTDTPLGGIPMFRTFRSTFIPILRDGQSAQYTVATDPVSGEVVKIDVTLTVLK